MFMAKNVHENFGLKIIFWQNVENKKWKLLKKTINELNVTLLQNLTWWKCVVILSYLHCHGNYTKEKKYKLYRIWMKINRQYL